MARGGLFLMLAAALFPLRGDTSTREFHEKQYEEALINLQNGNADEKINAAYLLGVREIRKYVRPIGEELVKDLDSPTLQRLPSNDPYVKSQIAWALGRIGHKAALPYLQEALEKTLHLIDLQLKKNDALRARTGNAMFPVVLDPNKPGPALLKKGHTLPYSPDVYWSVADEFKHELSVDPSDEGHRIRLKGYNYINLAMVITDSIGLITRQYSQKMQKGEPGFSLSELISTLTATFQKLLSHRLASLRIVAVRALGEIGTEEAMKLLEGAYGTEKDIVVKTAISHSVLMNDKTKRTYYNDLIQMLKSQDADVRLEAARALRDVSFGEAIVDLKAAQEIESDIRVQAALREAIRNAFIDNILPVNY